ncbi:hypothetical protein V8G54_019897 [Vigna mungo]|uniref:Uncharacterized protein n=1 Tax=Vigna mungo TaxID=3915 RepID=A0AAQ3NBL7_VIGMU
MKDCFFCLRVAVIHTKYYLHLIRVMDMQFFQTLQMRKYIRWDHSISLLVPSNSNFFILPKDFPEKLVLQIQFPSSQNNPLELYALNIRKNPCRRRNSELLC